MPGNSLLDTAKLVLLNSKVIWSDLPGSNCDRWSRLSVLATRPLVPSTETLTCIVCIAYETQAFALCVSNICCVMSAALLSQAFAVQSQLLSHKLLSCLIGIAKTRSIID